jgi:hypothetical protein
MRFLSYFAGTKPVYSDIPQIPGLLSVIFRLIEPRRNEIRSQLPLFEAKSSGCPPRRAGTRCFAFIKGTSAVAVCGRGRR